MRQRKAIGFGTIASTVFKLYPKRTVLGLALFIGQAFLYNAVFFTYALVLSEFYGVSSGSVGLYILFFAVGNFMGPLLLGRFFDSLGRRPMIAGTYILSGVLLLVTAFLFKNDTLTATTQTLAWCIIFFFASAGASSAYLTVSRSSRWRRARWRSRSSTRFGTAIGGITGPLLFGRLIESGQDATFWGYVLGASHMMVAGVVEIILGVEAAGENLENIAKPLTAQDAEEGEVVGEKLDESGEGRAFEEAR